MGVRVLSFIGQSNEQDRGLGAPPEPSSAFDSKLFQVGRWGNGGADNLKIIPLVGKLQHWGTPTWEGGSKSLLRYCADPQYGWLLNDTITAVPCANSGTSILQWLELVNDGLGLYTDFKARANLALAQPGATMNGLFMLQSEADIVIAGNPNDPWYGQMPSASAYHDRLLDLIDRIRADFGSDFLICFGHPTDGLSLPLKEDFKDAICAAAAARQFCHVVVTAGLSDNSAIDPTKNPVHFSADAQEEIAKRRFYALTANTVAS